MTFKVDNRNEFNISKYKSLTEEQKSILSEPDKKLKELITAGERILQETQIVQATVRRTLEGRIKID